jgi:circadian clock protein KaiC
MSASQSSSTCLSTGIPGLDFILQGGIPENRICLVHGAPGTGKSTLAFQFLLEGVQQNERVLYVTLLQTHGEVREVFRSHGWNVEGVEVLELYPHVKETSYEDQSLFDMRDMELNATTDAILTALEKMQPTRLVIDSLNELAMVLNNAAQFRFQIFKLKRRLIQSKCTAIMISGESLEADLAPLNNLVHGIIHLYQDARAFMAPRRRLEIVKIRGRDFYGGVHDCRIQKGGLAVFPRLERIGTKTQREEETFSSGNDALDMMLGGGLKEGTVCVIMGTPGVGKSLLSALYLQSAAGQQLRSAIMCFDESQKTYLHRISKLGLSLEQDIQEGRVDLIPIHLGEMYFGEFMHMVRKKVESEHVRVVVIDSLAGMADSLSGPQDLPIRRFHELVTFLNHKGILTIFIVPTHGLFGEWQTEIKASYLVDTVILLRHFEAGGRVHRCIAVMKKRYGNHEHIIREFRIARGGIHLGEHLMQFTGILTGLPQLLDSEESHVLNKIKGDEGLHGQSTH